MIDLGVLIKQTYELKPLPPSVTRLASIVANNDWQIDEVVELISFDQALTARMLGTANSAASASRAEIVRVKDAIVRLGSGIVLSMAMGASVSKTMKQALPEYGLSEGELWRHSVAAAIAAEESRPYCRQSIPAESFAAALLHDIGKLALGRFLDRDVLGVLARARNGGGLSDLAAEKEVLGVHHAELGGLITQHWKLPEVIQRAITYHESPDEVGEVCSDVVHLADVVAKRVALQAGTDSDEDLPLPDFLPGVKERLGVKPEAMDALGDKVRTRLEEVLARYQ